MDVVINLTKKWVSAGVFPGDTVLLHSNIKRTLIECRRAGFIVTPDDILDSFLNAVTSTGTILLPLFNFDFTSGIPFDIRTTPSQMGALTEAGRTHPDAIRTGHPIYSFAVIGANSKEFRNVDNESGYSNLSPFGILRELDGKIASLDLDDQNSMTFYHHVEEVKKVPYRYFKDFSGQYTDWNGESKLKTYKLYVRDLQRGVLTNVNPAGDLMWNEGIYKGFRPKCGPGLRSIKAVDMFNFVSEIIDKSEALGTLYSIEAKK